MLERDATYTQARKLVDTAKAGLYPLPPEILDCPSWAAIDRLETERANAVAPMALVAPAREKVVAALIDAAARGGDFPDGREVVDAELAERAAAGVAELSDEAVRHYRALAVTLIYERAESIITDYLRPRFESILSEAKEVATAMAAHGSTAEELLRAPRRTQERFLGLVDQAASYEAIREARRFLVSFNPPVQDVEYGGIFAIYKNLPDFWPTFRQGNQPPWPTDDRRRFLLWLVTSEAQAWLPTGPEQDALYREYFAEALARQKQSRKVEEAMRVMVRGY